MRKINIAQKFDCFSDHWAPRVIAQMNDIQFKLVKFEGEFVWHAHPDTDETFIVIDGAMEIRFRDKSVALEKGEMIVIPKGTEHKPVARNECCAMLVEPSGTVNTGSTQSDLTAENDVWI
jgi:mannose-6-phosphate isomerase-like protein (cupin superfamily)